MSGMFEIVLPAVILIGGAFIVYVISRLLGVNNRVESLITVLFLTGTLLALINNFLDIPVLFSNNNAVYGLFDPGGIILIPSALGIFIMIISIIITILITVFSGEYLARDPRYLVYYPLILLTQAGLFGMFLSNNLFNLFLLTELTTIAASSLIAFRFHQEIAIKAGFKYLIMSSLGTMMMLLGIYFFYRSNGDMHLIHVLESPDNFTRVAAACFLLGFSLKAGVFPLHTWVPDVYGNAPSAVSGLLAGVFSKSMLFILPVICLRLGMTREELGMYLMIFAGFNMLVGSIRMLGQNQLRRFLSFSSIAQTGYLMFGLGIGFYYNLDQAFSAGLFLFLVIAMMKCLAFLASGVYQFYLGSQDIEKIQGAGLYMPLVALCFSIALAGLAGIPLLAGFAGKWMIFSVALATGDLFSIIGLVVFLMSTLISLGGYLPVIVKQYQYSDQLENVFVDQASSLKISRWMLVPVALLALMVVIIGFYPGPWINLVDYVIRWMLI
ncbi:MAG: proton-conducting transporter membrane subunit [Chloroflexota bacterium]|nr:proton-conducting transporter membrane subunit [Chloroflexota bacterium]